MFLKKPVPHTDAAEFIRSKPVVPRAVFNRLLPELKARAFTVTGVEDATVLQGIRNRIAELPLGGNWEEIRRDVANTVSPWVEESADPDEQSQIRKGAERRAELLLRLHGFQAYSASAWQVMDAQRAAFPFWMYRSMGDERVRDAHRALDGKILPADSPFWQRHFPPWEWGCRCQAIPMDAEDVEEIRQAEQTKPVEQRRVLEGQALRQVEMEGRLVSGPNQVFDLRTPSEKGKPGAFEWNPGELRMSLDDLRSRYDERTWNAFETWAGRQRLPELNASLWEWLGGEASGERRQTIDEIFAALGLDKALWSEDDVQLLMNALAKPDHLTHADVVSSIGGRALRTSGPGSAAWVQEEMDKILTMLPPDVARQLPKIRINIERKIGGSYGEYDTIKKEINLGLDTILKSPESSSQLHETLWHEVMHWIHLEGPTSYRDTITQHFRTRTKGEPLAPMTNYGGFGRRDKWWNEYAGKQYVGSPFDADPLGTGVELPTRYFQLLANPKKLIQQFDPVFQRNYREFPETLKVVLSIFNGGHLS